MSLKLRNKGVSLNLRWYEIWGWSVVLGMLAFGLWGFYDGFEIGSTRAAWRFLFLIIIFSLPGLATMLLLKPKKQDT